MKKKLEALLGKKEARKTELIKKTEVSEDIQELRSISVEIDELNQEILDLRAALEDLNEPEEEKRGAPAGGSPVGATQIFAAYGLGNAGKEERDALLEKYEKRGADLKAKRPVNISFAETEEEQRAVSLGGGTLVNPKKYSNELAGTFNEVSSLLDNVNAVPLNGGESYTKAFEVSFGEADYTTETGNYVESDPVVDYVEIGKAKITAYTEITDEATKLPNINYQALVSKNVRQAIRKKITKQIMAGAGGANALVGIFNAPANVIPVASDIEISEIDADTLDKIVFSYGGDEDIEGGNYLILSKADVAAFAAIRSANGDKLYEIALQGNTGTITSKGSFRVPFIINSVCPVLSTVGTADETYCMAYGKLATYEMPIFSPVTIEESRDYKFRTGQIAYRGAVWVGGNVGAYKGFARVKKVAAGA